MKKLLLVLVLVGLFSSSTASAVYVNGYYRSNGTYVSPHYRSSPDAYLWNNYGYTGGNGSYYYPSYSYYSTPKLSKREKKVTSCQKTGKSELACKALFMKKKKKH